jgi:citrate synthase
MKEQQTSDHPLFAKGLKGVIANETGLSDVRGEEGRLIYCGYELEALVDLYSYTEIVYLLRNK